jgi:hypothetical protein
MCVLVVLRVSTAVICLGRLLAVHRTGSAMKVLTEELWEDLFGDGKDEHSDEVVAGRPRIILETCLP